MAVEMHMDEDGRLIARIDGVEKVALMDLSDRQQLSWANTVRQALRLYQSTAFTIDLGPGGCMGDE